MEKISSRIKSGRQCQYALGRATFSRLGLQIFFVFLRKSCFLSGTGSLDVAVGAVVVVVVVYLRSEGVNGMIVQKGRL